MGERVPVGRPTCDACASVGSEAARRLNIPQTHSMSSSFVSLSMYRVKKAPSRVPELASRGALTLIESGHGLLPSSPRHSALWVSWCRCIDSDGTSLDFAVGGRRRGHRRPGECSTSTRRCETELRARSDDMALDVSGPERLWGPGTDETRQSAAALRSGYVARR